MMVKHQCLRFPKDWEVIWHVHVQSSFHFHSFDVAPRIELELAQVELIPNDVLEFNPHFIDVILSFKLLCFQMYSYVVLLCNYENQCYAFKPILNPFSLEFQISLQKLHPFHRSYNSLQFMPAKIQELQITPEFDSLETYLYHV